VTRTSRLGDSLAVVRRQAGWMIGSLVVCVLLALAYSQLQARKYQASSSVLIPTVGGSSAPTIDRRVAADATIARSTAVADLAVQQAGMAQDMSGKDLLAASAVTPDTSVNPGVLHFTVTASGADNAVQLANRYAKAYLMYQRRQLKKNRSSGKAGLESLQRQIAKLQMRPSQVAKLAAARAKLDEQLTAYLNTVTMLAGLPNEGTQGWLTQRSRTSRNVRLASLFGLAVGLILAFVTELLRGRRRPSGRAGIRVG
jgi:capsular polysaccharide biosynthesis protein